MNYLVLYAKLSNDDKYGLTLLGIYLGGTKNTYSEASDLAKRCCVKFPGYIVIPRICNCSSNLMKTIKQAETNFQMLAENMYTEEPTI